MENLDDISQEKKGMIDAQLEIERELDQKKKVRPIKFNPVKNQFTIPSFGSHLENKVVIKPGDDSIKKIIFFALNTATYLYFHTDEFALHRKKEASTIFPKFIGFMSTYKITNSHPLSIFKDFETHRINNDGVLTQSTGLREIQNALKAAIEYEPFLESISRNDLTLLHKATEIQRLPTTTKTEQITLTDWFGEHTWLRKDDAGIGHELYSRLASPKAMCKSLLSTAVATLAELQRLRDTLYHFAIENNWKPSDFPTMQERSDFKTKGEYYIYRNHYFVSAMGRIQKDYHASSGDRNRIKDLLRVIITETSTLRNAELVSRLLFQNVELKTSYKLNGRNFQPASHSSTFAATTIGFPLIAEMVLYIQNEDKCSSAMPITKVERIMFCWLMAYFTVQPSDILKLTKNNFTYVKRRSGHVTHINIQYYKSRSSGYHELETIEANRPLGLTLKRFIEEASNNLSSDSPLVDEYPTISTGSTLQRLAFIWDRYMRDAIARQIVTDGSSPAFPEAVITLEKNGKRYLKQRDKTIDKYRSNTEHFLAKRTFSLTHIKNSSVHSRSDKFDPTQLMNYHSHTNATERASYLTAENEVWINNTGRITRMVMLDMASNLFASTKSARKIFNEELSQLSQSLRSRKDDTLSRIKVITGNKSGRIDNFGFVDKPKIIDGFEDELYLLDSPETVIKLLHYLREVEEKHHLIMASSPEYLLFTVLPTAEWIETVFDNRMLSRSSVERGEKLFRKYKDDLPGLFTAYLG
ncbi:hypothetical protein [Litorivivens sp.]|uniref:hypothetical protein n=1 Tax=Litorivivens sp. TaxID=2020868 RepID=UPI0035685D6B